MLYYITDRNQFPGDEAARRLLLLAKIAEAARCGVDYIQLREKDLSARELQALAREAVELIRGAPRQNEPASSTTRLLINSRTDVAIASSADGVHLRSNDISALEVRKIWELSAAGTLTRPTVAVSCHCLDDVKQAADHRATFVVFGPVFGKGNNSGATGIALLRKSCLQAIPVLALGAITLANAPACLDAGAAGIAGIRLFQQNNISQLLRALRSRELK
jgi:thiamine-phosphate pyrophosphorylase